MLVVIVGAVEIKEERAFSHSSLENVGFSWSTACFNLCFSAYFVANTG